MSDVVTYYFGVEGCGNFCPPAPGPDTDGTPTDNSALLTADLAKPKPSPADQVVSEVVERNSSPSAITISEEPAAAQPTASSDVIDSAFAVTAHEPLLQFLSLGIEIQPE
jgi:hypothetical protein